MGKERERAGRRGIPTKKKENTKNNRYSLIFYAHALYKVPGSSGSLVLTQTKGVTDR